MLYGSAQFGSNARFGNDGNVQFLLHFHGANASTTFKDSGPGNYTVTALGTGAISTAQYKFDSSSLLPGTGGCSIADAAALEPGSANFTFECWAYPTATTTGWVLQKQNAGGIAPIIFGCVTGAWLYYLSSNGISADIASAVNMGTFTINAWNHLALVRSGSTFTPYVNGVAGTTSSSAAALDNNANAWAIGSNNTPATPFIGYIDEFRYSKVARWTANFTPPPMPYGPF